MPRRRALGAARRRRRRAARLPARSQRAEAGQCLAGPPLRRHALRGLPGQRRRDWRAAGRRRQRAARRDGPPRHRSDGALDALQHESRHRAAAGAARAERRSSWTRRRDARVLARRRRALAECSTATDRRRCPRRLRGDPPGVAGRARTGRRAGCRRASPPCRCSRRCGSRPIGTASRASTRPRSRSTFETGAPALEQARARRAVLGRRDRRNVSDPARGSTGHAHCPPRRDGAWRRTCPIARAARARRGRRPLGGGRQRDRRDGSRAARRAQHRQPRHHRGSHGGGDLRRAAGGGLHGTGGVGGDAMQRRGEFRVSVTKDYLVFASAHFITFAGHRCEGLHGHNYRARVTHRGRAQRRELVRVRLRRAEADHAPAVRRDRSPGAAAARAAEGSGRRRRRRWSTCRVDGKPRYVFPRRDCALLPIPNTTVEMLAELLADRLRAELEAHGRARTDRDRDGSRRELRAVGRLSRGARTRSRAPRHRRRRAARHAARSRRARRRSPRRPSRAEIVGAPECRRRRTARPRAPPRARAPVRSKSGPRRVADAREIEHDHRADAGVRRARRQRCRRFAWGTPGVPVIGCAVREIQAEGDALAADRRADRPTARRTTAASRVRRRRARPEREGVTRAAAATTRRHPATTARRRATRRRARPAADLRRHRVEVGRVQLRKAERVSTPARAPAHRRVRWEDPRRPHRFVAIAASGARVHGTSPGQVQDHAIPRVPVSLGPFDARNSPDGRCRIQSESPSEAVGIIPGLGQLAEVMLSRFSSPCRRREGGAGHANDAHLCCSSVSSRCFSSYALRNAKVLPSNGATIDSRFNFGGGSSGADVGGAGGLLGKPRPDSSRGAVPKETVRRLVID